MDVLEEKWKGLRLREEEEAVIELEEEWQSELGLKEQQSIMVKICSTRTISREVVETTMGKIWRISKAAQFYGADKEKVWSGRPWLFDNQVLVMKEFDGFTPIQSISFDTESFWVRLHNLPLSCMTKSKGEQIRNKVGKVEQVDVKDDGFGWETFLRVQILLNLTQPLARGRMTKVKGKNIWIPFSYEKMSKICFSCGCIVHGINGCSNGEVVSEAKDQQYGLWMRAKQFQKNNFFNSGTSRYKDESWCRKEGRDRNLNGISGGENEGEEGRKEGRGE
ncbi:uncharacterized protein LOC122296794 [Carya illinoinensis]|uniref:uncharacterized protein LOC122296794 n=1 Tax=Carya illinoinensis TaxID=32201 RepID=UPI001C71A890|nr:uncharacterized protein LOC122296794 [Carya illinoinensis]